MADAPRIAVVDNGSSFHATAFTRPPADAFYSRRILLTDLADDSLDDVDILVVACRCNGRWLTPSRKRLQGFLARGGFLVAMGETRPDLWLDGIGFSPRETNFWWWLDPAASLGISIAAEEHPLLHGMTDIDITWHEHGVLTAPAMLQPLAVNGEGLPIMMEGIYGRGRLFLTTLDPFYHHGCWFMPATTRFLGKFLPNLDRWWRTHSPQEPLS
jgi:hypothetical protein